MSIGVVAHGGSLPENIGGLFLYSTKNKAMPNISLTRDELGFHLNNGTAEWSAPPDDIPAITKTGGSLIVSFRTIGAVKLFPRADSDALSIQGQDLSASGIDDIRNAVKSLFFLNDFLTKLRNQFRSVAGLVTMVGSNGTTVNTLGVGNAGTGTATGRAYSNATPYDSYKKIGYVGAGGDNISAGYRPNAQMQAFSDEPGRGGFCLITSFGNGGALNPAQRLKAGFGLTSSVFNPANDPSGFQSIACFAADAADTNIQFMHNDAAGNATKIDMGADFPKSSVKADIYRIAIWAPRGQHRCGYYIENLIKNKVKMGMVTSNLPAVNTGMAWEVTISSGANGASIAPELDFVEGTEVLYP